MYIQKSEIVSDAPPAPRRHILFAFNSGPEPIQPGETRRFEAKPDQALIPRRMLFAGADLPVERGGIRGLVVKGMIVDGYDWAREVVDCGFPVSTFSRNSDISLVCGPFSPDKPITFEIYNPTGHPATVVNGVMVCSQYLDGDGVPAPRRSRAVEMYCGAIAPASTARVSFKVNRTFQPSRIKVRNANFRTRQINDYPIEYGCEGVLVTNAFVDAESQFVTIPGVSSGIPIGFFDESAFDASFNFDRVEPGQEMTIEFYNPLDRVVPEIVLTVEGTVLPTQDSNNLINAKETS